MRSGRLFMGDFGLDARCRRNRWHRFYRFLDRDDRDLRRLLRSRLDRAVGERPFFLAVVDRLGGTVSARGAAAARPDETIKVVGLRRKIAENMQEAKRRIPHFTLVEEYDVTALEDTRAMMNRDRGSNPKLTLLPFLITAMARALAEWPMLNATYDDDANVITRSGAVHMGMATQTPNGLMVPVIRNAQALSVWQIASEILRLSEAARTGKAAREELSGSTITISSLGPMGGITSTPVINRPEVAILAVNKVEDKLVPIDGDIEIRKRMNLSLSCDHRVVDGWDAANFMQALKGYIENPLRLLSA